MPEAILRRQRHRLLHNHRALFVKRLLLFEERTLLTSSPYPVDFRSHGDPDDDARDPRARASSDT